MKAKNLFIISDATLRTLSSEVVASTVADLKKLGLYKLPYERVAIRFHSRFAIHDADDRLKLLHKFKGGIIEFGRDPKTGFMTCDLGPGHYTELRNVNLVGEPIERWFLHDGSDPHWRAYEVIGDDPDRDPYYQGLAEELSRKIIDALIVLLATRNAVKTTKHNTLANRGYGQKRPGSTKGYEYVTTISIPEDLPEDEEHHTEGKPKAPHLRRGHIRRQHYGPHNAFIKQVWIEPCFVNADADFVSTRKAYNVSI